MSRKYAVIWHQPGYLPEAEPIYVEEQDVPGAVMEVLHRILEVVDDYGVTEETVRQGLQEFPDGFVVSFFETPEGITYSVEVHPLYASTKGGD